MVESASASPLQTSNGEVRERVKVRFEPGGAFLRETRAEVGQRVPVSACLVKTPLA